MLIASQMGSVGKYESSSHSTMLARSWFSGYNQSIASFTTLSPHRSRFSIAMLVSNAIPDVQCALIPLTPVKGSVCHFLVILSLLPAITTVVRIYSLLSQSYSSYPSPCPLEDGSSPTPHPP